MGLFEPLCRLIRNYPNWAQQEAIVEPVILIRICPGIRNGRIISRKEHLGTGIGKLRNRNNGCRNVARQELNPDVNFGTHLEQHQLETVRPNLVALSLNASESAGVVERLLGNRVRMSKDTRAWLLLNQ